MPSRADAWFNRASSKVELRDFAGTIADLTEYLRLKPGDADALLERGNARKLGGDGLGARADITEALRLAPAAWELRETAERLRGEL